MSSGATVQRTRISRPSRAGSGGHLRSALALVAFLAISFAVAGLGSLTVAGNVEGWYADADKVAWNPPNAVFGPVWTVLYISMSVAAWLVWRRRHETDVRGALGVYVAQLVLNAVWSPLFFGGFPLIAGAALWIAFGVIVALDVLVAIVLVRFLRISRPAGLLFVPYLAWVLYATTLNLGLAVLNA